MPSMSYCMFENTSNEMDQILNSLDDAFAHGYTLKLRGEEKFAYERLIHQCQRFLKLDTMLPSDEEVDLADSCYIDADDLV